MRILLPGALWFFVSAWWFLADGWLAQHLGPWRLDLSVAFGVFAAFTARPAALPWLVLCAALARSLVWGGAPFAHVLLLGAPAAALFPLRRLRLPQGLLRATAAGVLALALAVLPALVRGGPPPLPVPAPLPLLWTMLTAPIAAALLSRVPPLWFFREGPA